MSTTNGPICSTNEMYGEATTSSTAWLLCTKGDTVRVCSARVPSGPSASGLAGEICWGSDYIYICVATNSWKRAPLSALLWL